MNTENFVIKTIFHREDGDIELFVKTGFISGFGDTIQLGEATFYSSRKEAYKDAVQYSNMLHKKGCDVDLYVMRVELKHTQPAIA